MNKKIILSIFLLTVIFNININFTYADHEQPIDTTGGGLQDSTGSDKPSTSPSTPISKLDNPIKANNVKDLMFTIVDLFIFLGSIVAVFMFLWIGFKFVMAQGSESELKEAKQWFLYAVIGTAILISSKLIVVVIKNTFVASGLVNEEVFNQKK